MNIFVSANNTNQGKTYSSLKLLEAFAKAGYKVGAMKPIETGVKDTPIDGSLLLEKAKTLNRDFKNITIQDVTPITHQLPAAPYVSGKVDFEKIKKSYYKLKKHCDVLIIEGAGGLLVPVEKNFYMIDFLDFFNARLFLVIGSRLGMINDFLLNRHYLLTNNIKHVWAINLFDKEEYFKISHPFMKKFNPLFIQEDLDKIVKKLTGE
ncbi:MAG: dethiobiotin synthase [Epsilonproteobacteria bacterium]|jgi:dethiobiotin synthetase|nr:dethiobiotin synthase [Campylobacterota bacterium]